MRRPSALIVHNRVFHSLYKVGRNGIIGLELFNNSKKKLPPVGLDLMQESRHLLVDLRLLDPYIVMLY